MVKGLAHVQSINDHIGVEEQDRLTYVTSVLVSGAGRGEFLSSTYHRTVA